MDSSPGGRGLTPKKSILKTKAKSSANPVRASLSTPTKSSGNKKTVEITTPPHSTKSDELLQGVRETPIPRVAFLAKLPQPPPNHNRKSSKKPSNRSLATNGSDKKKTGKKKKSARKIENVSASVPNFPILPHIQVPNNAGYVYLKELDTLNGILKSLADPATHKGHEYELINGQVRPFSDAELQQMIDSIQNVAAIHKTIPGSEEAEAVIKGMKKRRKSKKKKSGSILDDNVQSQKPVSSASAAAKKKSISSKPPTGGNMSAFKSTKSVYKPKPKSSSKKTKKKGQQTPDRTPSDSLVSDLSAMDMLKSELLNKKFYEESLALERRGSKESLKQPKSNSSKKRSKSSASKTSVKSSIEELQTPVVASPAVSASSIKSDRQQKPISNGLRNLEDTLGAISQHRAYDSNPNQRISKAVLINHSHVIRDEVKEEPEEERPGNRGYMNPRPLPFKIHANFDEIQGFDKYLQKIKYPGGLPAIQGLLDIPPPTTKLVANATEMMGKYLKNEMILEETRNKATAGSSKKERDYLDSSPGEPVFHTDIAKAAVTDGSSKPEKHKGGHRSRSRGSKGKRTTKDEGKGHKRAVSHSIPTETRHVEPVIEDIRRPPSPWVTWMDNSLAASTFPMEGASRWASLNQRTVKKSREIKSKAYGRKKHAHDELDEVRRALGSADERKEYLDNIVKARANFDSFNAYYETKKEEAAKRNQAQSPYQKAYGHESYSFDPRTNAKVNF